MAARHAGIVIGLLILTPIFTSQLEQQRTAALDAGTAILLESDIDASTKLELGGRITDQIADQPDRVPDVSKAFEPLPDDPVERDRFEDVITGIQDQLDRAATHAFQLPFLISALFALLALIPITAARRLDL